MKRRLSLLTFCLLTLLFVVNSATGVSAQDKIEPIQWGDMESWTVRSVKESSLIGGKTKTLYILGPNDTIYTKNNMAYRPKGRTCWGVSNAYAKVSGVEKAAITVEPEKRGKGRCAKLETRMETIRVIGLLDIHVVVAGSLFLGETIEPVRSIKDPYAHINMGIPFSRCPKAIQLDYRAKVSEERKVTKALGTTPTLIDGHDEPEVVVFLQKRWEDEEGNIYARRVGTARERFAKSTPDWKNGYRVKINYGDITKEPYYKPYMGLFPEDGQFKARNSKGRMVYVCEVGWAEPDETPTHVILMVSAGCYPAFYGTVGNQLLVDNICWVF